MHFLHSLMAVAALATSAVTATTSTPRYSPPETQKRQQASCNNAPELCDKQYNQVTHMGVHDSSFLRDESTGNSVAGNQYFNATKALDAGFRLLQAQVHAAQDGTLHLCHTTCGLLDAGPLQTWLSQINFWVEGHPNDVVTILLVNSEEAPADTYGQLFEASGLGQYGYVPTGGGWPTLGDMITSNKRVVTFVTNISGGSQAYPHVLDEFVHVFETSFEVTSPAGFTCALDRPSSAGTAASAVSAGMLPLLNHFMYQSLGTDIFIPDVGEIENTNSPDATKPGSVAAHAQQCLGEWGVQPTFILVDFWNEGPAIQVADQLNRVQVAQGRTTVSTGAPDGSSAGVEVLVNRWALAVGVVAALVL